MTESLKHGVSSLKAYKSCGTLPYWNLCECGVAISNAKKDSTNLLNAYRYLLKMDRDEYEDFEIGEDLTEQWESIVNEFKTLRHDSRIHEFETNKRKLLNEGAKKISELAMLESLKIEQSSEFLSTLISRGYKLKTYYEKGDPQYWDDIEEALQRVNYHDHRIGVLVDSLKGPDVTVSPFYKNMAYLRKAMKMDLSDNISVRSYFATLELSQHGTTG